MSDTTHAVQAFLASIETPFTKAPYSAHWRLESAGDLGPWMVEVHARDAQSQVTVHSEWTQRVTSGPHAAIVEFMTRANWHLPYGALELNADTGLLRLKCALDHEGAALDESLLAPLFTGNLALMALLYPHIAGLFEGVVSVDRVMEIFLAELAA